MTSGGSRTPRYSRATWLSQLFPRLVLFLPCYGFVLWRYLVNYCSLSERQPFSAVRTVLPCPSQRCSNRPQDSEPLIQSPVTQLTVVRQLRHRAATPPSVVHTVRSILGCWGRCPSCS